MIPSSFSRVVLVLILQCGSAFNAFTNSKAFVNTGSGKPEGNIVKSHASPLNPEAR